MVMLHAVTDGRHNPVPILYKPDNLFERATETDRDIM